MATTNPYEIKYGETLSGLASRLGTDVSALLSINPQITDPNKIQAGATLNLPSMMPAPKSSMGIVSTKTIADKVVVPAQKKLAEMTAPPNGWDATTYANYKKANPNLEPNAQDTAVMKGEAPTPKENPNQAIDGTIGTPIKLADALVTFNNDLTGLHQTPNGDYIPDASALERVGIKGVTTSSGIDTNQLQMAKAQKEAQDAQDVVTAQQKKLEQTVITDEDLAGTVKSITAAWDARIAQMERANKSRISALNTTGIRTGSQYTGGTGLGGVFGGIISEEERQGADRVTELEAQKQQAIAAAKQAQKTQSWQVFAKTMASAESIAEKKLDALKELQKAQAEQDKKIKDEERSAGQTNAIATLMKKGVKDPREILTTLNGLGFAIDAKTLKESMDALSVENPEAKAIGELKNTAVNNGAPQEVIDGIINAPDLSSAYAVAGQWGRGGSGIIGEYNFAKANGYTGSPNDYMTEDANRRRSIVNMNAGGLTPQENQTYLTITNKYQADEVINAAIKAGQVKQLADQIIANPNSATNQLASLYILVKNLDPNSAVRGEEIKLAQQTQNYLDTFKTSITRISKGQVLSPESAKALAQATKDLVATWEKTAEKKTQFYKSQASHSSPNVGNAFNAYVNDTVTTPSTTDIIQEKAVNAKEKLKSVYGAYQSQIDKLINQGLSDQDILDVLGI